jgi:hypothetical protein
MSLKGGKVKNQARGDLSALLEMNPKNVDDRTGAIDSDTLKRAKKEAALVHRSANKIRRKQEGVNWRDVSVFVLGVLILGAFLVAQQMNLFSGTVLVGKVSNLWTRIFSPLPMLDDVDALDYTHLVNAVTSSQALSTETPTLTVVLSNTSQTRPIFHLAGNLPEGIVLDLQLRPVKDTFLADSVSTIQFQSTLNKHYGKTAQILTHENTDLPQGEYLLLLSEDEDQNVEVRSWLKTLPKFSGSVPSDYPQGKKIVVSRKFFLGGRNDAEYSTRLKDKNAERFQVRQKIASELNNEAFSLSNWVDSCSKYQMTLQNRIQKMVLSWSPRLSPQKIKNIKQKPWREFLKLNVIPSLTPPASPRLSKLWSEAASINQKLSSLNSALRIEMNRSNPEPHPSGLDDSLEQIRSLLKSLTSLQQEIQGTATLSFEGKVR